MMTERSEAQRAADARYEQNSRRGVSVTLRLMESQGRWLTQQQQPGESRAAAVKRLAGIKATRG